MYTPPFMPRTSFSIISKMSDMRIKGDLRQLQRLAAMHAEVGAGEFFSKRVLPRVAVGGIIKRISK